MTEIPSTVLKVTDRWCCHRVCPHRGDGVGCVDCKTEHVADIERRGYPAVIEDEGKPLSNKAKNPRA